MSMSCISFSSFLTSVGVKKATNIVSRASSSSSDLGPKDYQAGRRTLRRKIEHYQPKVAAFVGITVLRELWPEISNDPKPKKIPCGYRPETIGESALFVLPNPSGRNAHFTYDQMLACWKKLAIYLEAKKKRNQQKQYS